MVIEMDIILLDVSACLCVGEDILTYHAHREQVP